MVFNDILTEDTELEEVRSRGLASAMVGKVENLIPLNQRDKKEALAIQRKGGCTTSQARKDAAKMRFIKERLKRGKNTDKDVEWIMERVDNSASFAYDMVSTAHELENDPEMGKSQKIRLLDIKNNIMRTIHGEKLRTENLNMNVNSSIEEFEKRLMKKKLDR